MSEASDFLGRVILDLQRGVVGKVERIHALGEYVSPVNQRPVTAPVVVLSTGEAIVADDGAMARWSVLEGAEYQFWVDVGMFVQQSTKALCGAARDLGIGPAHAFLIIARAFQVQAGALLKEDAA
jgi:hypothetical protein